MSIFSADSLRLSTLALLSALLVACSDSSDSPPPGVDPEPPIEPPAPATYEADIVWTEYGIPHVTADDWGGLGYGYGYAFARENYCTLMREYVYAAGESARYLGEDGDINSDLVYKLVNSDERINRLYGEFPQHIQDNLAGYAAGVNRYLRETGADKLAEGEEGCRNAEWVREVDTRDVVRLLHKLVLRGSTGPLADFTVAANPGDSVAAAVPAGSDVATMLASLDQAQVDEALGLPQGWEVGSNAYAIGEQASQSDAGLLLGNPHFPWQGGLRFFMFHLTLDGDYDVMGAALLGVPAPVIGFNRDVAWSHTVSTGDRFTFYELTLNPEDPMQYIYDGEIRELDSVLVSAEQLAEDGSIETVEHTFYLSHFGPIVDLGAVSPLLGGWPNFAGTLLTYRDANLDNLRGIEQWMNMGRATNLGEFKEALRPIGIPWVNTIAADRYGDAFYGDISVVPHVTSAQYNNCIRGQLQTLLTGFGYVTMDGADSECEWGSDEETVGGIFGYDSLPKLESREYAGNANDSYWLPNPRNLLTGYSPLIGEEGIEQSKRTRHTFDQAERRLRGDDSHGEPGFNIDNLRDLLYQADNYTADLMVDDVVDVCNETQDWSEFTDDPANAEQACEVLGNWDKRYLKDSVGSHIFYEFWLAVRDTPDLWRVPFTPSRPVATPHTLSLESEVLRAVRQALADAADTLKTAGIPMDRPWGEIQFVEKNGTRYPIHGGASSMMFSVISSELVDGEGYSNIRHGNSYIQAVTWDESDCPDAYAILTYSQSTDPASDHYADATGLYADRGWIDMPFCEAARDEQEIGRTTISE